MPKQMLAPACVLVLWTLVMLVWLAVSRLPALQKLGGIGGAKPGGRGQDLEGVLPDVINWKSHNYSHLLEQPTLFYTVSLILATTGANATDVRLAWAYVGLRVMHSLWQALRNTLPVRFSLFVVSSLILLVLGVRAAMITLG